MKAVILQARIDSRRLPGKSLMSLGSRPMVFRVMEALNSLEADLRILACPEDCAAGFGPLAEEAGFELVTGPKDDVLARYCIAIRKFTVDTVIRATGDNPFVFIDTAETLIREAENLGADYALYAGVPYGSLVEFAKSEALLQAERETESASDREHVCPYLYNHPDLFLLHRPLAPAVWRDPDMRLSVDTMEDYRWADLLYMLLARSAGKNRQGQTIMAAYRQTRPPAAVNLERRP
jgi:spore coat polysaccharide biosynthesis protein SpsF